MQQLLLSRSLLFTKGEDFDNWVSYCRLALKENQPELCRKTLLSLKTELTNLEDQKIHRDKKKKSEFIIEALHIECKFLLG